MSTFIHVISFPFWFFAVVFIGSAILNKLTLHYNDGMRRRATFHERIGFGIIGVILLAIAYFMTRV